MNKKEIEGLVELMEEHGLVEMELEKEGLKIKLRKGSVGGAPIYVTGEGTGEAVLQTQRYVSEKAATETATPKTRKEVEIKSPMVGTFYTAPSPDAPSYADVGSQIKVGEVICIIEAMKLMNEIKSEVKGKVVQVLVENGEPVEFGQPLFLVEPE
ncbi:MAG: acetyl-CoA carboxylase biotin carboxyl carrier protein [Candidatus Omnitrophica bacterium]|nr:acetyl-CoA carboxylase biotin carboxyl carrier protein [Candidatus Omnitrophota bacterium]